MPFVSLLLASCSTGIVDKRNAVARVNDRTISIKTYENTLNRMMHQPGRKLKDEPGRKALLLEMVDEELLYQAALKENLVETSDRLRREIARTYLSETIGKTRYEPSEDEIRAFFEEKREEIEKVSARHILIKPEKVDDEESDKKANQKAAGLLAKIRKAGAEVDFAKLAKEHSDDAGSKSSGGDLDFFNRGRMVKEFSDVAFAMKNIGEVSDLVKSQFGYHIIQLTGQQRGLDHFRSSIQWQIAQIKQKEKIAELLDHLRSNAKIELLDKNLKKVMEK